MAVKNFDFVCIGRNQLLSDIKKVTEKLKKKERKAKIEKGSEYHAYHEILHIVSPHN